MCSKWGSQQVQNFVILLKMKLTIKLQVQRFVMCSKEGSLHITKTYLYNLDPLKPHFYIVKLGFTGVYIIFLILLKNIDCGYSLEPPRGGSNEYPQSMFWAEIWKNIRSFYLKIFIFLVVNFSIYLNRRVFVMGTKFEDTFKLRLTPGSKY